jgi:5-methylthioadenosine/S-adenosylhomocysteine deaminase
MQPINNLVSNIVYSGSKDNIKLTMINGKILYQDGKFNINEDLVELYKTVQEINDRLNENNKYKI